MKTVMGLPDYREQVAKALNQNTAAKCYYCDSPSTGKFESWGCTVENESTFGYLGIVPLCAEHAKKREHEQTQRSLKRRSMVMLTDLTGTEKVS